MWPEIKAINELNPRDFDEETIPEETILHWFDVCNAVWLHDGDPKKSHAELTSGMCSNGYFNCPEVLKHPNLNEILARQLVRLLTENGVKKVDWVIGSAYADITFSYEVAKALGAIHGFTEKDPIEPKKKRMLWKRMIIPVESTVLQIEELITTSGTFKEVRRAVTEGNAEPVNFLSTVGVLVHRPPELPVDYEIDRTKIKLVPLIQKEIWAVDPSECPLCKEGSKRLRPKTHWKELTRKA